MSRFVRRFGVVLVFLLLVAANSFAGPHDGLPKLNVPLEQTTPRRALSGFLDACRAGDFARAAHYMDLRSIARNDQAEEGPMLAERLAYVLDRRERIDVSKVADDVVIQDVGGAPLIVSIVPLDEEPVSISLTRVKFDDGGERWLLARSTVTAIPALYQAYGPPSFEAKLPSWLRRTHLGGNAPWQWIGVLVAAAFSYAAGQLLSWGGLALARRAAKRVRGLANVVLFGATRGPLRVLLASIVFRESVQPLHVTATVLSAIDVVTFALIVFTIAWFAIGALRFGADWASERLPADAEHEIRHRVLRTQLTLLRQIATAVIFAVAFASVLMQFAYVRNVGLSLLASAGLVGIAFGLAAQKSLAGLIAGIQLSITQPIRIGDTVFVEHELGTVEKIHLTYVVVRLREQRMLVMPVSRFLDSPFENWTIAAPDVIGSVLILVDFATPVDKVREALGRACAEHEAWDRNTCLLEVTDATDRTITLRALVSSSNAAKNWTLRCFVRERLIRFLAELDGGVHLPRDRSTAVEALAKDGSEPARERVL